MDSVKYLLDTNICIFYLNGKENLNEQITSVGINNCYISEITILELIYGIENNNSLRKAENLERLLGFEAAFKNRILPIRPIFEEFSKQKSILKSKGKLISDFDLLIGSTAIHHNLTMVTRNTSEFDRLQGINHTNWLV